MKQIGVLTSGLVESLMLGCHIWNMFYVTISLVILSLHFQTNVYFCPFLRTPKKSYHLFVSFIMYTAYVCKWKCVHMYAVYVNI